MSYYDKRYIKGDPKKDYYKDDYENHCKKDCGEEGHHEHHEKEENGIYTELQVNQAVQLPTTGNIPDTPQLPTLPPLIQIARKTICLDDPKDRVLINATVEWSPVGTATGLVAAVVPLLLSIPASFKIWRKNRCFQGNSTPELIFETTDASPALTILAVLGASFGRVTTSFNFVDEDAPAGENEYILTMEPGSFPSSILGVVGIFGATPGFLPLGLSFTGAVTSHVLALAEIEPNN